MVKIDQFELPDDLYYNDDHIWVKIEDGKARLGLNDFGQHIAGKILFARTKPEGKEVQAGKSFVSIETGKWVGSLKSPLTGVILEVNPALKSKPSLINESPYGEGWLVVIQPTNLEAELKTLHHSPEDVKNWMEKEIKEKLKK
ncbi:MAG: glycine cleavage system protein H [Candidatus Odinarchaeum yellowstonii]|uniref:Probable glycine cleavage system H protein n=1 Tax=Odinarchaeota yellowstonii (strain LCB_4) TaxID=1841599 RepID=A0AAF0D1K7_ODILC|nr:MAG: glycine cleavage system protein H [Candidatus Odinarchaeum yellowstonii]